MSLVFEVSRARGGISSSLPLVILVRAADFAHLVGLHMDFETTKSYLFGSWNKSLWVLAGDWLVVILFLVFH